MQTFLAIDLGTSGCRSAVFDRALNMLGTAAVEYPLIHRSAREIEQDASLWWESAARTAREAVRLAGEAGRRVAALAVSSQSISLVPVDARGEPLAHALSWLDTRSEAQAERLEREFGREELFHRTGKRVNGMYSLPKAMWLAEERPELVRAADRLLFPLDFLHRRLCGCSVTDHSVASGSMCYDIHRQVWASDLLARCGVDEAKLPGIAWSGTALGTLLPEAARAMDLSADVVVAVGAQDQKCAALGAGLDAQSSTLSLGTACVIEQLADRPPLDAEARVPVFSFTEPGRWVVEPILSACGPCYGWFRSTFAPELSYRELDALAGAAGYDAPPVYFYPYFAGESSPHWHRATGTFTGLGMQSSRGQMARSVMEGIACNIRANLEVVEALHRPVTALRAFGGGAKGDIFLRIIADLTGKRVVRLRSAQAALAGAAMLAARAVGVETPRSLPEAACFDPDPQGVARYAAYYRGYEAARERMFS